MKQSLLLSVITIILGVLLIEKGTLQRRWFPGFSAGILAFLGGFTLFYHTAKKCVNPDRIKFFKMGILCVVIGSFIGQMSYIWGEGSLGSPFPAGLKRYSALAGIAGALLFIVGWTLLPYSFMSSETTIKTVSKRKMTLAIGAGLVVLMMLLVLPRQRKAVGSTIYELGIPTFIFGWMLFANSLCPPKSQRIGE